jgi:hypothetical protein
VPLPCRPTASVYLRTTFPHLRVALNDGNPARRGVIQTMIDGIRVDARDQIEPTSGVPAVRIESRYMGETWLCANHVLMVAPGIRSVDAPWTRGSASSSVASYAVAMCPRAPPISRIRLYLGRRAGMRLSGHSASRRAGRSLGDTITLVAAPTPEELDRAGAEAERLADAIGDSSFPLDPVYRRLDAVIVEIARAGVSAADLLPATTESGIGFSLRQTRDGKTLWQVVATTSRASICDPQGEVRQHLAKGTQAGASSLVAAILATLGLPLVAVPIAVTIAAVLLGIGIEAFCEWSTLPADEPGAS